MFLLFLIKARFVKVLGFVCLIRHKIEGKWPRYWVHKAFGSSTQFISAGPSVVFWPFAVK